MNVWHTPALCFMISFTARFFLVCRLCSVSVCMWKSEERGNEERSHVHASRFNCRTMRKERKNWKPAPFVPIIFRHPFSRALGRGNFVLSRSEARVSISKGLETWLSFFEAEISFFNWIRLVYSGIGLEIQLSEFCFSIGLFGIWLNTLVLGSSNAWVL